MDPLIGTIVAFAPNWAPQGWMPCDGRLLPIIQYTALFSVLGTQFGGDGTQTFALPKLDPLPCASGYLGSVLPIIAVQGAYPSKSS